MSSLASLSRLNADRKKDNVTDMDKSKETGLGSSSSPSLSALASKVPSKTTTSGLSSLASLRSSPTASANVDSSTTDSIPPRPSLSSLVSSSTTSRPNLSSLSGAATTGASGGSVGGVGSRPSLTSLARNATSSTGKNTATTTTINTAPLRPLSQLATNKPSTVSAGLSGTGLPPRRSLVGLARAGSASGSSASPTPSSVAMASSSDLAALSSISTQKEPAASPVGLTARSGSSLSSLVSQPEKSREMSGLAHNSSLGSNGGGGLGGLGGGRLQRQSDLGTKSGSSGSSSLSGLASRSLQSRASPSLAGLAGLAKKTEPSSLAPIYTQDRSEDIEVSRPSIAEQHSSSSQTVLYDDDTVAYGQESNESTFTMADQFAAASPFSSLIAKPSHFAISIFERLDPTPLPIAVKTAANIAAFNSSSSSIPSSILSTSATTTTIKSVPTPAVKAALLAETEALVLSKAFQFDQPSPDDIVFKAQGTRAPATGAPGSNK